MSNIAIRLEHISKQYRLGNSRSRYQTLRETIVNSVSNVVRKKQMDGDTGKIWALKDVSFNVESGQILGIIGRNGAGKTTLLKVISNITKPTTGKAIIYGRVGTLLEVGTGFHPELTGRENIYLYGAILGMRRTEINQRFNDIVEFSGVGEYLDTPMKFYSSGMFVRLAFAVAAHLETEILLVDEVLAVGDAEFQKRSMGKMRDITQSGRTVLFVSHNMNAIQQLCNRCIYLDRGVLVMDSMDVQAVIRNYMLSTLGENHRAEWLNELDNLDFNCFKPLRMSLTYGNGELVSGLIRNDAEVYIEIEVNIKKLDPALTIGYAIFNEDGLCIYWSYHTDTKPEEWPKLSNGHYLLRSRIPPRTLNEGIYRIELIASLHFREWLLEPAKNAPSIYLRIQGGLSDSPLWMMKRPGIIAPVIQWECQRIDD